MGEVVYVNAFERWVVGGLLGLMAVLAGAGAVAYAATGAAGIAALTGATALLPAAMVAGLWRRSVRLDGDVVVVRGSLRTLRTPLTGTRWGVAVVAVGMVRCHALAVVDADGRTRELSRLGAWSPRRGALGERLVQAAAHLDDLAGATA